MTIPARYENVIFRPLREVHVAEGAIVEVHLPTESSPAKPISIGDSPLAGRWKNREDIADSVGFIDRLRRQLHS